MPDFESLRNDPAMRDMLVPTNGLSLSAPFSDSVHTHSTRQCQSIHGRWSGSWRRWRKEIDIPHSEYPVIRRDMCPLVNYMYNALVPEYNRHIPNIEPHRSPSFFPHPHPPAPAFSTVSPFSVAASAAISPSFTPSSTVFNLNDNACRPI